MRHVFAAGVGAGLVLLPIFAVAVIVAAVDAAPTVMAAGLLIAAGAGILAGVVDWWSERSS